ncbi:hypothetical protein JOM56_001682 [Amanita muscaria]
MIFRLLSFLYRCVSVPSLSCHELIRGIIDRGDIIWYVVGFNRYCYFSFCSTKFSGAYVVLFGLCVYLLFKRRAKGAVNKPFLITAILAFTLNTGHIIVGIIRVLQAFSDQGSSTSAIDYYGQTWLPLNIVGEVLMITTTLVADIMVTSQTYRCYLLWSCQWKVIVAPVILLVASSVTAFVSVYNFSQLKPGQPFLSSTNINWGNAVFVLWLVTIVLITSLIVYRLRYIARQTRESLGKEHGNRYNYIMAVVLSSLLLFSYVILTLLNSLESGIIYAFSALVLVILCLMQSVYEAVALNAIAQITGITATLTIVRIGLSTITEGMPTDEYGSNATHTSRGKSRRVNIHTSGLEFETKDPSESIDDKEAV